MKFFRGTSVANTSTGSQVPTSRLTRRSSGLGELAKKMAAEDPLCVLDLGSTSAANIRYLTGRGHKIYSEDLLEASADSSLATTDEQGNRVLDSKRFLDENLQYPNSQFDIVLCWNICDYMDESLVKPTVNRLWSLIQPGGALLAFFHTREAGPDAPCYRYHILGHDMLEMHSIGPRKETRRGPTGAVHTAIADGFNLQRVFNNRHIENLFRDFSSIKFFLTRDNVREVLVIR